MVVAGAAVSVFGAAAGDSAEGAGALVDLAADRAAEAGLPAVGEMFFSDFA